MFRQWNIFGAVIHYNNQLIFTCSFWSNGNCVHMTLTAKPSSVFLLLNLPSFHLMYSAGSHYWVGGFTTVPSLLSSSQSLLSDSSLYCLSFLFLDLQSVVNRSQSWVGVSTSCHLSGTPLIFPMWQLSSPLWNCIFFQASTDFLGSYSYRGINLSNFTKFICCAMDKDSIYAKWGKKSIYSTCKPVSISVMTQVVFITTEWCDNGQR